MRFKSDGRRTSGTGTLPKRFISQPYAGILKCDSNSHPRTNCGMAQYSMNGSKRLTWLDMKKQVRCGSKPAERTTSTRAPDKKAMRRQNVRCNQSCLRASRKLHRTTSIGATMKKCRMMRNQSMALRIDSQNYVILIGPRRHA